METSGEYAYIISQHYENVCNSSAGVKYATDNKGVLGFDVGWDLLNDVEK